MFPSSIPLNYNNKKVTENERKLYGDYFREIIQRFGLCTYYYQNIYSSVSAVNLYGEDQVSGFTPAKPIMAIVEIPNESILFNKFGLQTDTDFNAIISIKDWFNTFGSEKSNEPKAGDVIRIINTGWDEQETSYTYLSAHDTFLQILNYNLQGICNSDSAYGSSTTLTICSSSGDWRRFPQMYQITEARYQDLGAGINFLMGHYVWLIRGKRFEYTYEPGIHPEEIKPDGSTNPSDYATSPKPGVVDDTSDTNTDSDDIFDYDTNPGSNTGIYGGY